jgi:hypothetical protein
MTVHSSLKSPTMPTQSVIAQLGVRVPMRDGSTLHAVVWRPRGDVSPVSAVMELTPYGVDHLHEDGVFWAWGANSFGQLGTGDAVNKFTPVPVSSGLINGEKTDFKAYSVFAGQRHSIIVTDSGDL